MNSIESHYTKRMRWSIAETSLSTILLFMYDCILYTLVSPALYGMIGTLFGCAYFIIKLCDFGMDKCLSAGYTSYATSKQDSRAFFAWQFLPSLCAYSSIAATALLVCTYGYVPSFFSSLTLTPGLIVLLACFICIEGCKALIKKVVYLSGNFRRTSISEIAFIGSYQLIIYIFYALGYTFSAPFFMGLCALLSLIDLIYLLKHAYKWYTLLPETSPAHTQPNFFVLRSASWGHSMSRQLLSSNMLVPLFGYMFGLEYAAQLKLVSSVVYTVRSLIEKSVDPVVSALFAYTKKSSHHLQYVFHASSSLVYTAIICIFIFITINFPLLSYIAPSTSGYYAILYCLVHGSDLLFIVIERLYAVNNKAIFALTQGLTNFFIIAFFFYYMPSPTYACVSLIGARVLLFCIFFFSLPSTQNVQRTFTLYPRYLIASFIASIIFFLRA